jgi:aspartyl/asparaginyl-tRNA synthetase
METSKRVEKMEKIEKILHYIVNYMEERQYNDIELLLDDVRKKSGTDKSDTINLEEIMKMVFEKDLKAAKPFTS